MLYLDLGINNEDFLTEKEKNSTSFIRKIKVFVRKHIFQIFDGSNTLCRKTTLSKIRRGNIIVFCVDLNNRSGCLF